MQKIYAHRGASGYAPENTLRAFEMAADMGAYGVELDVQISKDGRLVVFHDDEMSRLTGYTGSIADYTYAELCRMPVIHAVEQAGHPVILVCLNAPYLAKHAVGVPCVLSSYDQTLQAIDCVCEALQGK